MEPEIANARTLLRARFGDEFGEVILKICCGLWQLSSVELYKDKKRYPFLVVELPLVVWY